MTWLRIIALCAPLFLSAGVHAQSFMLSPGSIFLSDDARTAELLIANTQDRASIFRIEAAAFRMSEDGTLVEVVPAAVTSNADSLVRFSPRQFEIGPGETQVVRIGLRMPATLPPGEYRTHLRVLQVGGGAADARATTTEREMGMAIPLNIARAVRVIVRHGVAAGSATVASMAISRAGDALNVTAVLRRSGSGSSTGTYRIGPADAPDSIAAGAINIYADLDRRTITRSIPASSMTGHGLLCFVYADAGSTETRRCATVPDG